MRVIFSPGGVQQTFGGVSRYVFETVSRLNSLGTESLVSAPIAWNQYFLNSPKRLHDGFSVRPPGRVFRKVFDRTNRVSWQVRPFFKPPDVVHQTYYFDNFLALRGVKRVLTVYDMIHERFPAQFRFARQLSDAKLKACNRADVIITISDHTRVDLVDIFGIEPGKVVTVPLAGSIANPFPREQEATKPFFLHVGGRQGYKNFAALLRAISTVPAFTRREVALVVFGGGAATADEYELMIRYGIHPESVEFLSGDDTKLANLYSRARALIYPSLYEGFGIPPLEAMSAGCPVIAGDNSSLPEVVGDAGLLVDTSNPQDIAGAISAVNEDSDLRLTLSEKGVTRARLFSWEKTAKETLAVYRSLVSL